MGELISILGFTTQEAVFWNLLAYSAVLLVTVGIFWEKVRLWFFFAGGVALALYSALFLESSLFTVLQLVLTHSAYLQLLEVPRRASAFLLLWVTAVAVLFLLMNGHITTIPEWVGTAGFLAIIVGIVSLPRAEAFIELALGGLLLVIFAYATGAWAFFVLNLIFALANVWEWTKTLLAFYKNERLQKD